MIDKHPPETVLLASPCWPGMASILRFNHFRLWKWRLPAPCFWEADFCGLCSPSQWRKMLQAAVEDILNSKHVHLITDLKTIVTTRAVLIPSKESLRRMTGLDKEVNIVTGFPSQGTEWLLVSLLEHFWNATYSFTSLFTQIILLLTKIQKELTGAEKYAKILKAKPR